MYKHSTLELISLFCWFNQEQDIDVTRPQIAIYRPSTLLVRIYHKLLSLLLYPPHISMSIVLCSSSVDQYGSYSWPGGNLGR